MKDDAASIVTGILIQSDIQSRNDQIRREQQAKNNRLSEEKDQLQDQNNTAKKKNNILAEENDDLLDDVQKLAIQNRALATQNQELYNKAVELQDEVDELKLLLRKPIEEIAEKDAHFKRTYDQKMQIMAEWMVSQKAFKELAIQFGFEQGLSSEDVIQQASKKQLDVLDNKNDPSHNTNIDGSKVVTPERAKMLKDKLKTSNK